VKARALSRKIPRNSCPQKICKIAKVFIIARKLCNHVLSFGIHGSEGGHEN
jgi:hypothetical protein